LGALLKTTGDGADSLQRDQAENGKVAAAGTVAGGILLWGRRVPKNLFRNAALI
jgi:hypothetical protein